MRTKIYVEGGGSQNKALRIECQHAFSQLFEKAGFKGRMPRMISCGGRRQTFDRFCTALSLLEPGETVVLLVDSEGPLRGDSLWLHVNTRPGDGWNKPRNAGEENLHFMVECMESWFLADKEALAIFFGEGFQTESLPGARNPESITKADVYRALKSASRHSKRGIYEKASHSFKILSSLDIEKLRTRCEYARRLFDTLDGMTS